MELISKDRQNTTIKFTTDEIIAIRSVLTGLIQEYKSIDVEIIGVSKEYIQELESGLYALREKDV